MEEQKEEKKSYWPLIALFLVSVLMGLALSGYESMFSLMRYWLGSFLCLLSLVKLFNIKGFMMAYTEYDLLAKRVSYYGYVYPFIELALGLSFFYGQMLFLVCLITLFFMVFGACGVFQAIKEKKDITCACMGSILKVPLTHVSFIEDVLMAVMSLILAIMTLGQ